MKGKACLVLLLIFAAAALQGCSGAAEESSIGKASYGWGNLESVEDASIEKVHAATLKALEDLKLPAIQKDLDSMSGKIVARDVADKKIIVTLRATTDGNTKLSIRVGTFGDEAKSHLIYEQIKKKM